MVQKRRFNALFGRCVLTRKYFFLACLANHAVERLEITNST
jgi:hypothetical protein